MTNVLKLFDRASLAVLNVLVFAGMPLAAVGLMTNAL
jgi:hypothetical protein